MEQAKKHCFQTHTEPFASKLKKAFTLAEALITLAVVGVVSAIVIPLIISNVYAYAWEKEDENFKAKINEAMNQMKTNEVLTGYATSADFVEKFKSYIKINSICSASNLSSCFISKFFTASKEEITTSSLQTGANFGKTTYTSPLVGVQFNNGIQGIISYNPSCAYVDAYDNRAVATDCLSMVYDLNGYAKPNVVGKDIILYDAELNIDTCITISTGLCVDASDMVITPIASGSPEYLAMKAKGLILYNSGYAQDYWAGAVYQCDQKGMHLAKYTSPVNGAYCPATSGGGEACDIARNSALLGINGAYWSGNELSGNPTCGWNITPTGFQMRYFKNKSPSDGYNARCVK